MQLSKICVVTTALFTLYGCDSSSQLPIVVQVGDNTESPAVNNSGVDNTGTISPPLTTTPVADTPVVQPQRGPCVDTVPLNDGYGWDGVETCTTPITDKTVDNSNTQPPLVSDAPNPLPTPPPATMPMDIDWSWAIDQWFGCRVTTNDLGDRWAWKLNSDGLMVDQFNVVFGAWTETDYNGERQVLFLDQGGRQEPVDIWIDENSFMLHPVGSNNAWGMCSKVVDPVQWLAVVEPNVINSRPHSRFDNTRWYCSIRVGPTWIEGYTIELHRNGDVIGYEQRFDNLWRPFGTQGSPRYFATWQSIDNDERVRSDSYGILNWDRRNNTLESGPDTFRCRLPKYFSEGTLHPSNRISN